jgi:hypothetical protein
MQLKNEELRDDVQRNMDLVRDILRAIEQNRDMDGTRDFFITSPKVLGISNQPPEEVSYDLRLLIREGMVDGRADSLALIVRGLTWSGHEFLDNIKSDSIWAKVKDKAGALSGVSMKILAALAEAEVKKHFGLT